MVISRKWPSSGPFSTCISSTTATIILITFIVLSCSLCAAQGTDSSDQGDMSQDDMGSSDPSIVNPVNKQGYGKDVATQLLPKMKSINGKDKDDKNAAQTKDMVEESIQAALQFGVLVRPELEGFRSKKTKQKTVTQCCVFRLPWPSWSASSL